MRFKVTADPVAAHKMLPLLAGVVALVVLASPAHANAQVCSHYATQAAAQQAGDTVDADKDGIYCETLPCPCSTAKPLRLVAPTEIRAAVRKQFKSATPALACVQTASGLTVRCSAKTRTTRYTASVVRTGPLVSPVDRYRVTRAIRGRASVTRSDRVIVKMRTAAIGEELDLVGLTTGTEVQVTPGPYVDPVTPANPLEVPPAGQRFLAVHLAVKNLGHSMFDDNVSHSSHLLLVDGESVQGTVTSDCLGRATVSAGMSTTACIVFAVPTGVAPSAFQYSPYGVGLEMGIWR